MQAVTQRGIETRNNLLRCAEEVFGQLGYYRASISEICRRAGVAQGTFYLYFKSKEDCFAEVVHQLNHQVRQVTRMAIQHAGDRIEVERLGLAAFLTFLTRHRYAYRIVRQAEFVNEALFREYYTSIATGYAAGLKAAMESDQIARLDPEALAYALMGIADFAGMRWVLWNDRPDAGAEFPAPIFEDLIRFIVHGIAKPDPISANQMPAPPVTGSQADGLSSSNVANVSEEHHQMEEKK